MEKYEHLFYERIDTNKELNILIDNIFGNIKKYKYLNNNIIDVEYDGYLTVGDKESVCANLQITLDLQEGSTKLNDMNILMKDIENILNIMTNSLR